MFPSQRPPTVTQSGVTPDYIDPEMPAMQQLAKALDSPPRASLLLFEEKAIALYAAAFVGTQSR